MGHVLQQVWFQGRDPFKVMKKRGQRWVLVRIWRKLGGDSEGCLKEIVSGGV